ncbi:solute carrier family 23 protein [Streptomyces sp. NPDC059352]|uniref:solute carrier family 23 protein n=1 Tax=Streptomyces sp. NPDC059352 TaxID=3346810 RepID=UPI0036CC0B93
MGGLLGTSLMVTSAENIGIGRLTGVRSRFVTAGAGVLLIGLGLATPVSRALAGIPEAVVGGSSLVVYAVIAVMGVEMLRRADLSGTGTGSLTAALALTARLLPLLTPDLYAGFPAWARTILGSVVVAGTLTAVLLAALLRPHSAAIVSRTRTPMWERATADPPEECRAGESHAARSVHRQPTPTPPCRTHRASADT